MALHRSGLAAGAPAEGAPLARGSTRGGMRPRSSVPDRRGAADACAECEDGSSRVCRWLAHPMALAGHAARVDAALPHSGHAPTCRR